MPRSCMNDMNAGLLGHEPSGISPSLNFIAVVALALSTAMLGGCRQGADAQAPRMPPPAVSVAEVIAKEVAQWDEFPGHIEAVETVRIQPRVAGYLKTVNFQEGEEVQEGDVLFVIDQRPFQAELAGATAELARAQARAELARAQAARARKLLETHVIPEDEVDERSAADAQARADIRAAEAAVEIARLNLEYTEIRSPIDGRTGRALVTAGNLVSGGEMVPDATLLTTVVSLDPVYAYFEADEATYLRYAAMAREVANRVRVGLASEENFPHEGRLDFVDNQVDPATGTIRVRAVLDNRERLFTPGLFARIRLAGSGNIPAVLVDDKAILTDQDRKYVYVLAPDNTAQRRDVRIGRAAEGLRIVTHGLMAGDKVIVHGVQKIFFPGMPVAPQMITMGDPPPPPGPPAAASGEPGPANTDQPSGS